MRLKKKVAQLIARERVCRVATVNEHGVPHLYSDDWAHIKGVMVQGTAKLFSRGPRFRRIRELLYEKYPHYRTDAALSPSDSVVVEVTPIAVFDWELD